MIVDTSALIAILKGEPEATAFKAALLGAASVRVSTATYFGACVVADGFKNPLLGARFDEILEVTGVVVEPVTAEQARIAHEAYRNYGKGSGHRAQLNFGDCFSYALARVKREPLLFKGDNFIHTDVRPPV